MDVPDSQVCAPMGEMGMFSRPTMIGLLAGLHECTGCLPGLACCAGLILRVFPSASAGHVNYVTAVQQAG
jgi:hypothetical protein